MSSEGLAPSARLIKLIELGTSMPLTELEADLLYEMNELCESVDLEDKLEAAQTMAEILAAFVEQAREQLRCRLPGPPIQ